MQTKACVLLASALLIGASSVATADALVKVKTETVRYDDIRLSSRVGVAVLYGRLRSAAERACAPLKSADLSRRARYRECMDSALANAVAQVNHPGLTEYYESKTGIDVPASAPVQSVTVVAETR